MSARSMAVHDMLAAKHFEPFLGIGSVPVHTSAFDYLPSRSNRTLNRDRKVSLTVTLLMTTTRRVLVCESGLEEKFAIVADADPQIEDIEEQTPTVRWQPGKKGEQRPDFRVTLTDGRKLVVAVKPEEIGRAIHFPEEMAKLDAAVKAQGYADGAIWMNEHALVDPISLANATAIRNGRRYGPSPDAIAYVHQRLESERHVRMSSLLADEAPPGTREAAWVLCGTPHCRPSLATPRLDAETVLMSGNGLNYASTHRLKGIRT